MASRDLDEHERQGAASAEHSRPRADRAFTWRSILLGLAAVLLICGLTPFNDYAMANTMLVGNFLPIGLLLFFLVIVLLVNAPLSRFAPRWALTRGELGVAMAMALVSCALPGSGLMRYLPTTPVGLFVKAGGNTDYADALRQAGLPDWVFPAFESTSPASRANEKVITDYFFSARAETTGLEARLKAVPWTLWRTPAIAWGLLAAAVFGAVLCLCVIVRRQWSDNERLPFPLATVYVSLIEPPPPGRALNSLLSSRTFWIAAGFVFLLHAFGAGSKYAPRIVPEIPMAYNFIGLFVQPPLIYCEHFFKTATIYFCVIGVTFFLQTKVAFSLWFMFVLLQIARMAAGSYQAEFTAGMQTDQSFGALVTFSLLILWVGRQHWWMVLKQMIRGPRSGEARGRYLPYRIAGWGFLLCCGGIVIWLMSAGASAGGAILIVAMLSMLYLCIMRVVAETGLVFVQFAAPMNRPWIYALGDLPNPVRTTPPTFFLTNLFHSIFSSDLREALPVFSSHAMRVADQTVHPDDQPRRRRGWPLILVLALALAVGFLVSGASMLLVEYTYAATLDTAGTAPINDHAIQRVPESILKSTYDYTTASGPRENHSRTTHFLTGAGLTGVLSFLRLRFANWPLHPIGYLVLYTYATQKIWFSVMLGWMLKSVILRFGGSSLYRTSRPFFIGLIVGETTAAAFWLVFSVIRHMMGLSYHSVNLLPG